MKIYLNLTNNVLNICFSKNQKGDITLFDQSWNCVHQSSLDNEIHKQISVKGIATGVYILQVNGYFQKVFIK